MVCHQTFEYLSKYHIYKYCHFMLTINLYYTGNHTVAVIKGHESYDLLKSSGKDVFSYINKLIDDANICIDGKEIPTDICLGGDFKVYYFLLSFTDSLTLRSISASIYIIALINKHSTYV